MNLTRKIELAVSGLTSIATHEDEDAEVRKAALDRIIDGATAKKAEIDAEVAARVGQL